MQSLDILGQKTIKVKDSEIEFTFIRLMSWKSSDDGYNYILFPPDKFNKALLNITYYENSKNTDIDEIFEFAVKHLYPVNEKGFKIIDKGEEYIGSIKAKWLHYESIFDETKYENIIYMFNDNGQTFKILGSARQENFNKFKDDFIKVIKSINSIRH